MRDWLLKDLRLKLFCLALAVLVWEAIHLELQHAEASLKHPSLGGTTVHTNR
jgi:hypothetical protein